ncbi:MAG: ABC transporter substrate-binding protein [Mycetocola sp.]
MPKSPLRRAVLRRSLLATVAAATAIALSACAGGTTASTDSSTDSITVLTPSIDTQISWDAGYAGSANAFELMGNTNAQLIRKPYVATDQQGVNTQDISNFEGVLAESYEVSEDGLVYTFKLREGVLSQQGNELTADDVIWSFERKFASKTSITPYIVAPALTDPTKQFTKIGTYEFSITIDRAGYGFTLLSVIADVAGQIYDSTYLKEQATDADPYATEWSKNKFNFGYGAYTVTDVQDGTSVTLTAFKDYVLGEPEIKTIVFRAVADPSVRASTLTRGDADVAETLKAPSLATLAESADATVPNVDANSFLIMSLVNNKAPFDDVEVRRAFAYAIDYDQIVSQTFQGRAAKTNTFLPSSTTGYDGTGLPDWSYDPAKAKDMLSAAGYPDGVSFTVTIGSDDTAMQDAATQIQSSAAEAGFTMTIDKQTPQAFQEGVLNGTFQANLKTDAAISLAPSYELVLYTTPNTSGNLAQYDSEPFRAAVEKGLAAGDATSVEAGKAWNEAERIWLGEDVANVFIAKLKPAVAYSSKLTDWAMRTDSTIDFSVMHFTD